MRNPALKKNPLALLGCTVCVSALILTACGESPAPAENDGTGSASAQVASEAGIAAQEAVAPQILSGWVRTPPCGRDVTAGYITLRAGDQDDQLVAASSPIAGRVELHTMEHDGEVMRMRQVEAIDLPAETEISLAPGGDHLMIFGVDTASLDGKVEVTLEFASGASSTVRLPLSATAPEADASPADADTMDHGEMDHEDAHHEDAHQGGDVHEPAPEEGGDE